MRVGIATLLSVLALCAQTNRGGINGTVFDPTGAAIPNATVTITNLGTNQKTVVKTSESGAYSAPSLDPVSYNIAIDATGFSKKVVGPVKVDTAAIATVDVTLQAGQVT